MGPLRRFEKRLEKMFESPFARAFKGGVHPLEIARRLTREVDDGRVLGVSETLAPNTYRIFLSPGDYERLAGFLDNLASEMESMIIAYANQRDYHLLTRPRLSFEPDGRLVEGEFQVRASLDEPAGVIPAVAQVSRGQRSPAWEIDTGMLTVLEGDKGGYSYRLEAAKTRIGRSEDNDLVLEDQRISRFHAEIDRLPEGYVIKDLGSTNGTMVKGRRVRERLLEDGDTLEMGETRMTFGHVAGPSRP